MRQGAVRLAVRRRDGEAARRLRARPRSRRAEAGGRGGAAARARGRDPHLARPVVSADRGAQERHRRPNRAGAGVLERGEEEVLIPPPRAQRARGGWRREAAPGGGTNGISVQLQRKRPPPLTL